MKLKACGFNTVETYVAWNAHEPKEGHFNFQGIADVERFVIILGMDVLLFTSDGYDDSNLQGGALIPDVLATVNFGSRPEEAFAKLQEYQPDKPLVCMQYWNGWFDYWGDEHHRRGDDDVVDVLDRMLKFPLSFQRNITALFALQNKRGYLIRLIGCPPQ